MFLYRAVAAALVVGVWALCFQVASAAMRQTYTQSLVLLKTKSDRASPYLRRIFGSVAGYAMALNLLLWGLASASILARDTEDRFGFAATVVSWEFPVNPTYLAIVTAMTIAAFGGMVWKYNAESYKNDITMCTYDKVVNAGMAVWMASGVVIWAALMMYEHRTKVLEAATGMPSGGAQGDYVALAFLAASSSAGTKALGYARSYDAELSGLRSALAPDDVAKLDAFVRRVKGRVKAGDARSLSWAMRDSLFDADTRGRALMRMDRVGEEHSARLERWKR